MAHHLSGLFTGKAILVEEQQWYYLTHSWEDKGAHAKTDYSESENNNATGV